MPTFTGTPAANLIGGLVGQDTINGLAGNDTLYGDPQNGNSTTQAAAATAMADSINGGSGDDIIFGDRRLTDDTLPGGNDSILGGEGADMAY